MVYVESYPHLNEANADYAAVTHLYRDGVIGVYDAAVVSKDADEHVRVSECIERSIERHDSRGERPCLIAAKHIQAAEVLNGREMLDDDFSACHGDGAL